MLLYAGMNITLKVRGTDDATRRLITDAVCTVNLYGPGKNPQVNPDHRATPDYTARAVWDESIRHYKAVVSTQGWTPGIWWMQGVLTGGEAGYQAFGFEHFTLSP